VGNSSDKERRGRTNGSAPFYGMPKNPRVTGMSQQRGGRGVVDVGCSFFHVLSAGSILTAKALSLSRITLRAKGVFSVVVLVTGRFAG